MIEVFKTNVMELQQAGLLKSEIQRHFPDHDIHFDLQDCDKVLRIEGQSFLPEEIMAIIRTSGYHCEVME